VKDFRHGAEIKDEFVKHRKHPFHDKGMNARKTSGTDEHYEGPEHKESSTTTHYPKFELF